MESMENDKTVSHTSHRPWKSIKPISTTGMVRRLFKAPGYLGWQEVQHGDFDDWH
jgi:hypothetical protein